MTMITDWTEWLEQYETDGYFIARGVLTPQEMARLRETVNQAAGDAKNKDDVPPLDLEPSREDEGESSDLQARFRRILHLESYDNYWNDYLCHPNVVAIMRRLLGDNIRLMGSAAFLKPARHGGVTPWHQDVALWKYKAAAPTIWTAIDPSTKENGCLQLIPGSHRSGEVEHVLYDSGLHKEVRRDLVAGKEPVHIELAPGDAAVWTSAMFHYSPPNPSDQGRLGLNGVYCSQQQAERFGPDCALQLPWVVKNGDVVRR